jgi:hypothetical protein
MTEENALVTYGSLAYNSKDCSVLKDFSFHQYVTILQTRCETDGILLYKC